MLFPKLIEQLKLALLKLSNVQAISEFKAQLGNNILLVQEFIQKREKKT